MNLAMETASISRGTVEAHQVRLWTLWLWVTKTLLSLACLTFDDNVSRSGRPVVSERHLSKLFFFPRFCSVLFRCFIPYGRSYVVVL